MPPREKDQNRIREKKCEASKKYYELNKQQILARRKAYYAKNQEKKRAYAKEYSEQYSWYVKERKKAYYAKNQEKIKAKAKVRRELEKHYSELAFYENKDKYTMWK